MWITTQCIFVECYGLCKLSVVLHDDTHIVKTFRTTKFVRFHLCGIGILLEGERISLLHHQCTPQIVYGLWVIGIFSDGLAVCHFCLCPIAMPVFLVALADKRTVGLCLHGSLHCKQQNKNGKCFTSETRTAHVGQESGQFLVFPFEKARLHHQQQYDKDAHDLELFVIFAVRHHIGLALLQPCQVGIKLLFCIAGVVYMYVPSVARMGHLAAHILVKLRHYGIPAIVLEV